jgi:hypothetical protein
MCGVDLRLGGRENGAQLRPDQILYLGSRAKKMREIQMPCQDYRWRVKRIGGCETGAKWGEGPGIR